LFFANIAGKVDTFAYIQKYTEVELRSHYAEIVRN